VFDATLPRWHARDPGLLCAHVDVNVGQAGGDPEPGCLEPRFLAGPELDKAAGAQPGIECLQHRALARRPVAPGECQRIDRAIAVLEVHSNRMTDTEGDERDIATVG
jgi:hypothetical protein